MDEKNTAVVYTSGVCNLNCRYCAIDKNPILKEIDKTLAESFDSDYYFERIKKYFPNKWQLKRLETWGGEPFLYMSRIYPLIHNLIDYYPYFDEFFSSTNFSYSTWESSVFGLINQFNEYPYRDFTVHLQLSCDGPEYINDLGRGHGVTAKCLKNYQSFIQHLGNCVPENVTLSLEVKPTLDVDSFKLLDSKEKIIEYYHFFEENFIQPVVDLDYSNVSINYPVPNIAVPAIATQEDGFKFAAFCKNCRELEKENYGNRIFKFYNEITLYGGGDTKYFCKDDNIALTYNRPGYTCGSGTNMMGFLPHNMLSTCNEGFTEIASDYKEYFTKATDEQTKTIQFNEFAAKMKNSLCLNEDQFDAHCEHMSFYLATPSTARLGIVSCEISMLALAGLIDKKYSTPDMSLRAALALQDGNYCMCIKDNKKTTGSLTLFDYGIMKLLLNGALDYIQEVNEDE